ncbi:hypothetical protein M885DRAFT_622006 [Pelagophyceae sp. CCMP2097]|nr:hypothetical protein M885DRAFT_622006 [Pelagophyceae sp. CCMP2097]
MSAWGAAKRGVADVIEAIEQSKLECVVILSNRTFGAAEAVRLAAALKSPASRVAELRCSGHDVGETGARALGEAVGLSQTLTAVDLGHSSMGDAQIASFIEGACKSTKLLSLELDLKDIGDAGASALANGLKANSSVETVVLSRNVFGSAEALAGLLDANKTIKYLDVSENAEVQSGLDQLLRGGALVELRCSGNAKSAFDARLAQPFLAAATRLQSLDVSGMGLDDADAVQLARGLGACYTFSELRISRCNLTAVAAEALAAAAQPSEAKRPWQLLDVSANAGIGAAGAALLMACDVATLLLNAVGCGDAGAALIAATLATSTTKTLGLSANGLTDVGAQCLASALVDSNLLTLEVGDNLQISAAGVQLFKNAEAMRPGLDVALLERPQQPPQS